MATPHYPSVSEVHKELKHLAELAAFLSAGLDRLAHHLAAFTDTAEPTRSMIGIDFAKPTIHNGGEKTGGDA